MRRNIGSVAWLGTVNSGDAWCADQCGSVIGGSQFISFVVAPAFNLDLSKVRVKGDNEIVIL